MIYLRGVFVPNRLVTRWSRTHPVIWFLYNLATTAALIALAWFAFGRTVAIFAAGFFVALDLVLLGVMIGRVRANRRSNASSP